jgi:chromate reductase
MTNQTVTDTVHDPINILAITGSLRAGSVNRGAVRAAAELAALGVTVTEADLNDIPLYSEDTQAEGMPEAVLRLGQQIAAADAVLFATPEYKYSIPGVLKNAIDWVSRLPDQPFAGKAAGIIGVSPGNIGTARAQYHLRQIGVFLDLHFLNKPEVMVGQSMTKFDADGRLTDEDTRTRIAELVTTLAAWAERLQPRAEVALTESRARAAA